MMYRIVYDGEEIYGPSLEDALLNPTLETELNSAGTLTFTVPYLRHLNEDTVYDLWNHIEVFRGEVQVWEGDRCLWFGRPYQIVRNWNNDKIVTCEGALAYFNDSLQVTHEYSQSNTPLYSSDQDPYTNKKGFINSVVELHNDQVRANNSGTGGTSREIFIGEIDVDNEWVYRHVDYETTADILQQMCLDTNGGYFILRKGLDDHQEVVNYLDWRKNIPNGTGQEVAFGLNLLDVNQDLNGADICTVLFPQGNDNKNLSTFRAYTWENPYHIQEPFPGDIVHESGSVYIIHKQGYERFGRVVKQKDFQGQNDLEQLFYKAAEWLNDQNNDITTIECSAADLHYLSDPEYYREGTLEIGQLVQVSSGPHDLDRKMSIYKVSMKLDSGAKTITLGTPPKRELTDIIKSGGGSTRGSSGSGGAGSDGGSGSSGSVVIPVKDVQVKLPGSDNFGSVVSKKVAKIDLSELGSGDVTDVKVNDESVVDENGVANITIPAPPDVPVQDVYLDGESVLDNNGIAQLTSPVIPDAPVQDVQVDDISIVDQNGIAKLDSSDFGTTVIANPAGASTDDLETIQIGNTIYSISGGGGSSPNYGKFTCDRLFVNDFSTAATTGTASVTKTYTLSKSIDDYDALYVEICAVYMGSTISNKVSGLILKPDFYDTTGVQFMLTGSQDGYERKLMVTINSSTQIETKTGNRQSNVEPVLYKVYGLKFQNKLINRSDIYSEDEQMIGRWIDGKPLYQKTIIYNGTLTKDSSWHTIAHNVSNIEKCVSLTGTLRNTADDRQYEIGIFRPSDKGITLSVDSTNIYYTNNWIDTIDSVTFTLQYTKTTDAAGSGVLPEDPQLVYMSDYYSEDEQVVGRWTDGKPLYQKTYVKSLTDLARGSASSSQIRGALEGLIPSDADIVNIVDELSFLQIPWDSSNSSIRSVSLNYPNGSTYIRTNIQENNDSGRFIYIDITYSASQMYQYYMNTAKIVITLQYTKTTDAAGTGPTKGNLIYLPSLYSTEEREVGVWTDGRPLYQRVIEGLAVSCNTNGWTNILKISDYFDDDLSYIHITDIIWDTGDAVGGNHRPIGFHQAYNGYIRYWPCVYADTINRIVIQYTKSHDAAGSGTWTPEGQLAHHYSTSEHIVGTWIDGSTVYERSWDFGSNILIGANTWDTSLNIDSTNINIVLEAHGNHADGTMYALEVDPTRSNHTLLGLRAPNQANIRYFTLRYTKT